MLVVSEEMVGQSFPARAPVSQPPPESEDIYVRLWRIPLVPTFVSRESNPLITPAPQSVALKPPPVNARPSVGKDVVSNPESALANHSARAISARALRAMI